LQQWAEVVWGAKVSHVFLLPTLLLGDRVISATGTAQDGYVPAAWRSLNMDAMSLANLSVTGESRHAGMGSYYDMQSAMETA
jgi:hypothetical protein